MTEKWRPEAKTNEDFSLLPFSWGYHPLDADFQPGNTNLRMGHVPFRVVKKDAISEKEPRTLVVDRPVMLWERGDQGMKKKVRRSDGEHLIRNPREESGRGD
jgi:hypothetical protein